MDRTKTSSITGKHSESSRYHGSLYQDNTSISPRFPSNSKWLAPLQYVNLEKYDIGDHTASPCEDNDTRGAPCVTPGNKQTTRRSSSNKVNVKISPLQLDTNIRGKSLGLSCRSDSSETKEGYVQENDCQREEQCKSPPVVPPNGRSFFKNKSQVEDDNAPTVLQRRPCIKFHDQCLTRKHGNKNVNKRLQFGRSFSAADVQDDDQPNSIIFNHSVNESSNTSLITEENYLQMINIPSKKGNASAKSEQRLRRQSKNIAEVSLSIDTSDVAIPFPDLMSYKNHLSSNATYKPTSSGTRSVPTDKANFWRNSPQNETCVFTTFPPSQDKTKPPTCFTRKYSRNVQNSRMFRKFPAASDTPKRISVVLKFQKKLAMAKRRIQSLSILSEEN